MKSGQLARSQFCALRVVYKCWRAVLQEDEPEWADGVAI